MIPGVADVFLHGPPDVRVTLKAGRTRPNGRTEVRNQLAPFS